MLADNLRIIAIVAFAALLAAAAFYGIMLARAANSLRSRNSFIPSLSTEPEHSSHAASALSSIIKFKTISRDNPDNNDVSEWVKLRDRLRKDFPNVHKTLTREVVADYSLLYIWKSDSPVGLPLLLSGHLDVVDAKGKWEHPPFGGVIDDGYVWGRGALDCKCNIISMLEAIELLIERGFSPKRDVYLAFSHDHESDTVGASALSRVFAERGLSFYMVLDEGGWLTRGMLPIRIPVAQIGVAEKGRMRVKLTVDTNGGHASVPPAHSAVGLLAEAIARVEYKPQKAVLTPIVINQLKSVVTALPFRWRFALNNLPITKKSLVKLCEKDMRLNALIRSTIAAVSIQGGGSGNVLPDEACAFLDIRLLHGDSGDAMLQFIRDMVSNLGVLAEETESIPPSALSEHKCEQFACIKDCITSVFGSAKVSPSLVITSTCSRQYERFCANVYRFSPFPLTPIDQVRLHGRGEGVRVESLGLAVAFYRELINNICS